MLYVQRGACNDDIKLAWVRPKHEFARGGLRASRISFPANRGLGAVACIFVDGENFRHAICALFENFRPSDYLPKTAEWHTLFDWLAQKVHAERLRAYWYVVAHIGFFPYKFPDAEQATDDLKRVLSKDDLLNAELGKLEGPDLIDRMKDVVADLRNAEEQMSRRFAGWTTVQNNISTRHSAIEFRRAGAIPYNLFRRSFGREKAVDVKLGIDLIMLRDIYDTAVIVSGDQDYVPAVQAAKDYGKRVVNVAFETRGGKLLPGGARRLNQMTDDSLHIKYHELSRFLFPRSSGASSPTRSLPFFS